MSDEIWKRDEIESPCVKLCLMHPTERICMGCYRSIEEIAGWGRMTPEARRAVMADLHDRAPRVTGHRRGGHAGRVGRRGTGPEA